MERKQEKRTFGKKDVSRKSNDFVNYLKPDRKQSFEKKERSDKPFKPNFEKKEENSYSKPKTGEYGERPRYGENRERSFGNKSYGDRENKPSFQKRDDRPYGKPSFHSRDEKPSFHSRDDKPSFHKRDEKPDFRDKSYHAIDKEFEKDSSKPHKRIHHKKEKPYNRYKTVDERTTDEKFVLKKKARKRVSEFDLPKRDRPKRADVLELGNFKDTNRYEEGKPIRLNKYIANAGICSRREADELISSGVVSINGVIVTEMGTKVNAGDSVQYDGTTLISERKKYVLLNKPKGYITTTDDPQERRTVMALVKDSCKERIYPVGRLDRNTSGLLLFTNDGDLAKKLTHPKHGAKKIYHVELDQALTKADMDKIYAGIELEDGIVYVDEIAYIDDSKSKKEIGVEIHSGKNRVIRRIFESLGYEVTKLDRVMFADLTKKDISRGMWRFLTDKEVAYLKMLR
jgi:23S rRNA pseudouridine2605 synthase